ncbi:MAG: anthranilate phosphoribosyltransferase [Planctomycetes bacterium]|nr:anthranilate phosphoribosyltransferase [Planctomycetota bacterium]
MSMFDALLGQLTAGEDLSLDQMSVAIDAVMRGEIDEARIGLLLMALRAKGETVDELAGAASAMRKHMTPVRTTRSDVLDTCGTGGDGSGTFNISTAASLVAAGAGLAVAKHGNRSITSRSGSADVLAELGINIEAEVPVVEACLAEVGICFCFAPKLHPAMRHVAAVRRKLGVPTIFNLLGPLCNPASAPMQLLGSGKRETARMLAAALCRLGTRRAIVVTGDDGLDEVTLAGPTHVLLVQGDDVQERTWKPEDFGLATCELASLRVDGPQQSAALIRDVVVDRAVGPARDIVVANAAAALWVAGKAETLAIGARLAGEAIDQGTAAEVLSRWAQASRGGR